MIIVNKGGGTSVSLYTQDGTLTGNRTVTHAGYTLTFGGTTRVVSPSASALDTAFGVRDNTDTSWYGRFLGGGVFQLETSATRMLRFTTNDYALGVDGNGYMTYSSPKINGVLTGHRVGRVDGSGNFTQIGIVESNDSYNSVRYISINGQTNNLFNLQDHNGNIKLGYNPQSGELELNGLPTSSAGLASGKVWNDGGTLRIV
jgi:hypothetical protein